jgi:hypothetical protein
MANPPNAEEVVSTLGKRAEALAAAASMKVDSAEASEMDSPVREMLMRAADLVRGAALLGMESNATALGVVARALLENLISILWVQVDPAHAGQLKQAAVAEVARMARVNLKAGKARIVNRHTGEDATAEFLASDRFKNIPRRTSVEERAKQAGVEDLYDIFYRALSMEIHGHSLGRAEKRNELAMMHMQGIGAIALATGHSGARWLLHRERTDNETLRSLLGFNRKL